MNYLVTGSAGFIGYHLCRRLLSEGHKVTGLDAMTPYYDLRLKEARLRELEQARDFRQVEGHLEDAEALLATVESVAPDFIVHLAAQAGVRYSLENPRAYIESNLVGTFNLLEAARHAKPKHLLLASTSSIYGANAKMPFSEQDPSDHQLTLYAATKKGMEAMSHSYAHLWKLPTTCFRFFTVYGPLGRPDMAPFKFTDAIYHGRPIDIYGEGRMSRDFTYVGDLVEAITRLVDCVPAEGSPVADFDTLSPAAPWRVVNIAGGEPVRLLDFIALIEELLGKEAKRNYLPMQKGDVPDTLSDYRLLERLTRFRPSIPVRKGMEQFISWYLDNYANVPPERRS